VRRPEVRPVFQRPQPPSGPSPIVCSYLSSGSERTAHTAGDCLGWTVLSGHLCVCVPVRRVMNGRFTTRREGVGNICGVRYPIQQAFPSSLSRIVKHTKDTEGRISL
jgi:hypothetical protein